ncbi:MAG: thioredoxin family protein [Pseudomonadota bacterium]
MVRSLALTILALTALLFARLPAQAEPVDAGHAVVDLVSERAVAIPGETVYFGLHLVMDEDWHVYWRNPGDAGLAPVILWDEGAPFTETTRDDDFSWPVPELLPVLPGEIMDYGYSGAVTLPFAYDVPSDVTGLIRFSGTADYLICKDVCIPETAPVTFTLEVGDSQVPDNAGGALIAEAFEALPTLFEGAATAQLDGDTLSLSVQPTGFASDAITAARFLPHANEIKHAQDQAVSVGPDGLTLDMVAEPREPLGDAITGVLTIETANGTRTGYSITASQGAPLPGTTGTPLGTPGAATAPGGSGINILTIALFALLGGMVLNLMPCVLPVLSIKALGMVQAAASGEKAELRSHGLAYTLGVVLSFLAIAAVFVALRAAGEFVSLGFQLQYPAVVAGLALVMFVIGLWMLGVFELGSSVQGMGGSLAQKSGVTGSFFTGVLAAIVGAPCVGPFLGFALGAVLTQPAYAVFAVFALVGLGLALPFLVLSYVPGLQRLLPKPGAWMERLKQFFAFPMFLTAVWLLTVLGDQAGNRAVTMALFGAVLLGLGIWAVTHAGGPVRRLAQLVGTVAVIAGLLVPIRAGLTGEAVAGGTSAYAETEFQTVQWSPEAVTAATAAGQGVFVDFTATWCMICQANKRTTLNQPQVRQAMDDAGIVFMVADFTSKDETIASELKAHGRPGVPMYLLYGPGQSAPTLLPEALTPALMLREIDAVATAAG